MAYGIVPLMMTDAQNILLRLKNLPSRRDVFGIRVCCTSENVRQIGSSQESGNSGAKGYLCHFAAQDATLDTQGRGHDSFQYCITTFDAIMKNYFAHHFQIERAGACVIDMSKRVRLQTRHQIDATILGSSSCMHTLLVL